MFRGTKRRVLTAAAAITTAGLCFTLAAPAQAADPTLTESYTAVGSSHIAKINADLPITKTKLTATLDLNNFQITKGTLPIAPQVVSFKALGYIPIRGTTTLTQAGPITGSLTPTDAGNILKASVAYTIKLTNLQVQFLGVWLPLNVGNNCQTISPAVIPVASPKGKYFDIANGGTVTGTYTIGNFQNCAPLMLPDPFGIGSLPVNALIPGPNNTVNLKLSDGKFVSST